MVDTFIARVRSRRNVFAFLEKEKIMSSMKLLFRLALCLSGLGIALPLGLFLASPTEVKAATSPSSGGNLSTTLDLNDTSESDVRAYYSDLRGKNLSGDDLLEALHPILQNFNYFSYDNCWKIFEITDRDWSLSPASSMSGTYNESKGTVTGYVYESSTNDPYVRPLYRNRDSSGSVIESGRITANGSHTQTGGINREHVWCQSRGFKASTGANGPAGTDVHHLMLGDGFVNGNGNQHNNNPYGFVDKSKT